MKALRTFVSLTSILLLFGSLSKAQIVAWDFNGNAGNEVSVTAQSIDSNLESSSISRGAGINASALANSFSATAFDPLTTSLATAISADEFFSFTITPKAGYEMSLSSLDVNFRRSGTGPNAFQWQYSLDGFNTAGINLGSEISFTDTTTNGVAQTQISLSGLSNLQSITATSVTFRLYAWGATANNGTFGLGRLTGNDLSIGGTTALAPVPEPSTYAAILGGVALVGVMVVRRRKTAAKVA